MSELHDDNAEDDGRSSRARQAIIQFHKETDNNDKASNFVTPRYVPDYLTNEGGVGGSSINTSQTQHD